ncbi:MAG: tol-pal system protein YbgF [Acidovorax sp.]|nr:tol-pal system protein YbgF [Acidovorax sp.]MDR3003410.1 tol-pal system protein YbgF [Acidovorax sp.]
MTAAASQAALFSDDEARRAILEVRQRVDALQQRQSDEMTQLRRSVLDMQQQIETLRSDVARLTGQNEQLVREASELQRKQKDMAQGVDERLRQFEPVQVTVDGQQFLADPAEKRDFDAALALFRAGQFPESRKAFAAFVNSYPKSGYVPSARFWLGNTQYAGRDYKEAIANFRSMLTAVPNHERAPEATLSIANCQIEMKDTRAARKTLEDLLKAYPNSEAAVAAKDRLARLK